MRQHLELDAYEYCRRVTQRASKTFYWGSMFLPPPKRQAIWAVYAFCRSVDDCVDEAPAVDGACVGHLCGSQAPARALEQWRLALEALYRGEETGDEPVLRAWRAMLQRYEVPLQPALDLLKGVEMDLTQKRYTTFDDLYLYCYRVAGTVGLLTSPIFGYSDGSALAYAVDLGVALQLTNILRDIGEDARRDRIYLPEDEMARFNYSEAELQAGIINAAFCDLVSFQMERAYIYYQRAQPGIALLSPDCRLAVQLSSTLYRSILDCIRANEYNVFTCRASVPWKTKLMTASTQWITQQWALCMHDTWG